MEKYHPGFTWDDYDAAFIQQEGRCAICSTELLWDHKGTHIDHCHVEGVVRGLLCYMCNTGLGSFRDDADLLLKASQYLERVGR